MVWRLHRRHGRERIDERHVAAPSSASRTSKYITRAVDTCVNYSYLHVALSDEPLNPSAQRLIISTREGPGPIGISARSG